MSLGLAHGNVHADQTVGGPRANTRRRRPAALHTNKNMQEEVGTSCTPQRGCARRAWPYLQPDSSAGCTLEFPVSGIHLRFVFLCAPSSEAGINNMACEAHWKAPADQTVGGPGARKFKSPGGGGSPPSTQNNTRRKRPDRSAGCTSLPAVITSDATGRVPPSIHSRFVFSTISSGAGVNNMACGAHWKAHADQTFGGPGARKFKSPGGGGPPPSTQDNTRRKRPGLLAHRKGAALGERGPTYNRIIALAVRIC